MADLSVELVSAVLFVWCVRSASLPADGDTPSLCVASWATLCKSGVKADLRVNEMSVRLIYASQVSIGRLG